MAKRPQRTQPENNILQTWSHQGQKNQQIDDQQMFYGRRKQGKTSGWLKRIALVTQNLVDLLDMIHYEV